MGIKDSRKSGENGQAVTGENETYKAVGIDYGAKWVKWEFLISTCSSS